MCQEGLGIRIIVAGNQSLRQRHAKPNWATLTSLNGEYIYNDIFHIANSLFSGGG